MDFNKCQPCSSKACDDSDSGVSTIAVEQHEVRTAGLWDSAFEDDVWSLPSTSSSSVTTAHNSHEAYLRQMQKLKSFGNVCNIAKEMLQTERTFVKDLEVLVIYFRNGVENNSIVDNGLIEHIFANLDPLYHCHCSLMSELAGFSCRWEKGFLPEADLAELIIEVMCGKMNTVIQNVQYMKNLEDVQLQLEASRKNSLNFQKMCSEFQLNPLCYLPLNSFLLKPVQRLFCYRNMFERLVSDRNHADNVNVRAVFEELIAACKGIDECRRTMLNLNILMDLQRNLCVEGLVHPKRQFIREGCLHKICRKGPEPRMFFLLSDVLLYTKRGLGSTDQFCARAALPLHALRTEDGGVQVPNLFSFTITNVEQGKSITVAACSLAEKKKWLDDIQRAVAVAKRGKTCDACGKNITEFTSKKKNSFECSTCLQEISPPSVKIKQITNDEESYSVDDGVSKYNRRTVLSQSLSTRKVCWQRNASIGINDYMISQRNNFSGYLRRRYKNTNKWQKMWTVFTNFCLYFFRNCDESVPFANLPLIGYVVCKPSQSEAHDCLAIKLQFKTHVSIFKADKEYDFKRWMEILTIQQSETVLP